LKNPADDFYQWGSSIRGKLNMKGFSLNPLAAFHPFGLDLLLF